MIIFSVADNKYTDILLSYWKNQVQTGDILLNMKFLQNIDKKTITCLWYQTSKHGANYGN